MTTWCTDQQLQDIWPASATELENSLGIYLAAAEAACRAYAPALADDAPIPASYTLAVATQTRNLYNASKVDSGSFGVGEGEYSYQPHPLDWQVKQLLRPKTGRPLVG